MDDHDVGLSDLSETETHGCPDCGADVKVDEDGHGVCEACGAENEWRRDG